MKKKTQSWVRSIETFLPDCFSVNVPFSQGFHEVWLAPLLWRTSRVGRTVIHGISSRTIPRPPSPSSVPVAYVARLSKRKTIKLPEFQASWALLSDREGAAPRVQGRDQELHQLWGVFGGRDFIKGGGQSVCTHCDTICLTAALRGRGIHITSSWRITNGNGEYWFSLLNDNILKMN